MKIKIITISALCILLSACAANDMYYWGSYENTLYNYTKEPSEGSLSKHKSELEKIITKGSTGKKGIPPGIYFELAVIEAKAGNNARSLELFNMEKTLFPEATVYVDNAIKQLGANS